MAIFKKIYNASVTIFTVIVMLCAAMVVIPHLFGINSYVVKSNSMQPVISVGDLAFVNTKNKNPDKNDMAIYKINNKTFVCHRVVKKSTKGYIFKGDANKFSDSSVVKQENIVGTYIFSIPKMGYVFAWFNRFRIIILILLLIALNISVIAINNLSEYKKVN